MKLHMRRRARMLLLQALYQWVVTQQPVSEILVDYLSLANPKKVDLIFFKEELIGIVENQQLIDQNFQSFLDRPIQQLSLVELAILRIGVYEIVFAMIPYRVVINEALELAKKFGSVSGYRYVNGILDQVAKLTNEIKSGEDK